MNATRLFAAAVLGICGLIATSQALAQKGWYIGGSAGASRIDDDIAMGGLITSGTVDGSTTGFKIFGGYQFFDNFALDLALVDLGKAKYSGTFFNTPVTGGTVDIWGLNISAVGILPVSESFSVFGKVGVFAWEADAKDTTGGIPFSTSETGADFSFGLGMSYSFTKHWSVRFEWERFKVGGGEDAYTGQSNSTGSAHVDLLSLGVAYRF
jgi:OOP family OmpA-OmpF porin